jgi:hypothetical protein
MKPGRKAQNALDAKLKQLYEAIRDYKEPKNGRQLSLIFMKLPSKNVRNFRLFILVVVYVLVGVF